MLLLACDRARVTNWTVCWWQESDMSMSAEICIVRDLLQNHQELFDVYDKDVEHERRLLTEQDTTSTDKVTNLTFSSAFSSLDQSCMSSGKSERKDWNLETTSWEVTVMSSRCVTWANWLRHLYITMFTSSSVIGLNDRVVDDKIIPFYWQDFVIVAPMECLQPYAASNALLRSKSWCCEKEIATIQVNSYLTVT